VLTVGAIDDQTYGGEPFALVVGGAGNGAVSATATGACTVNGLTVTIVAAGQCTVTVSKAATSNYAAATPVTRIFSIAQAAQTLTVDSISDRSHGAAPFDVAIGGVGPGAVSSVATGSCTVSGLTVTIVAAGQCTVTVSKAATSNYAAATPVTRTFSVAPAVASPDPVVPGSGASSTPAAPASGTPTVLAPVVTGVSPAAGPTTGKKSITITGTSFTGATSVTFGIVAARFTVMNSTTIVATSPAAKVGTYDIRITTPAGTSVQTAADRYVVRPLPTVTKLSSTSGPKAGHKKITIRGTGFTGATIVTFGKDAVAFAVKNNTTIIVKSPSQKAGKYDVRVTTPGGTSAKTKADRYTVKK